MTFLLVNSILRLIARLTRPTKEKSAHLFCSNVKSTNDFLWLLTFLWCLASETRLSWAAWLSSTACLTSAASRIIELLGLLELLPSPELQSNRNHENKLLLEIYHVSKTVLTVRRRRTSTEIGFIRGKFVVITNQNMPMGSKVAKTRARQINSQLCTVTVV